MKNLFTLTEWGLGVTGVLVLNIVDINMYLEFGVLLISAATAGIALFRVLNKKKNE